VHLSSETYTIGIIFSLNALVEFTNEPIQSIPLLSLLMPVGSTEMLPISFLTLFISSLSFS
jgi:hypothetical protein